MARARGHVSLVGAGPGDPGLLTLKGADALGRADVVLYDHLVSPAILRRCRPQAVRIYVGKEADRHTATQQAINRLLIREARAGRSVVRLKGGDPFVFGRGGEEALALAQARVAYDVVPGISSAVAAPAYAGIPVTHRAMATSVAVVTGHEDPTKPSSGVRWDRLATACDTLVILMGVGALPGIAAQLRRHGRRTSTPCAVIEWGTLPSQRVVTGTLATIAARARQARVKPPAVVVVGDVASLRGRLSWFEAKPLFGRRILVTRAADKAGALTSQLEALGAAVEELPAIEIAPVKTNGAFHDAVDRLPATDWVFFTSPEGIERFSQLLKPLRKDVRALRSCHIGAIGPKTAAAIEACGLHVDFIPRRYSQDGMVRDFPARIGRGKRGIIFSAEESRDALIEGLRRRGMQVSQVPVYRTITPRALRQGVKAAFDQPVDFVTVTSASCVDHLHAALAAAGQSRRFRRLRFASIGPVTSQAVRARGGRVAVEAAVSTIEGLVDAIRRSARRRP
jgi:uroporphyrinogen III methyltransferase/synthase